MSLSYKAITGDQNTSQRRNGPEKLSFSVRAKPVLKGASLNVLSHATFDISFNARVGSRPSAPLDGVDNCLVYCSDEMLHLFVLSVVVRRSTRLYPFPLPLCRVCLTLITVTHRENHGFVCFKGSNVRSCYSYI